MRGEGQADSQGGKGHMQAHEAVRSGKGSAGHVQVPSLRVLSCGEVARLTFTPL